MTQPIDIISRALKDIGALEAGETPAPADSQDAFDMLNDMCDQWSNEQMMVFYKTEIIFTLTSGQTQYTIGAGGQIGGTITGSISGTTLTVTNVAAGAIALAERQLALLRSGQQRLVCQTAPRTSCDQRPRTPTPCSQAPAA